MKFLSVGARGFRRGGDARVDPHPLESTAVVIFLERRISLRSGSPRPYKPFGSTNGTLILVNSLRLVTQALDRRSTGNNKKRASDGYTWPQARFSRENRANYC